MKSIGDGDRAEISPAAFAQFVQELMPYLDVRIVSLNYKNPKADENACDSNDEAEFFNAIGEAAIEKGDDTIDLKGSERILIDYFKGINAKYCFVALNPNYAQEEEPNDANNYEEEKSYNKPSEDRFAEEDIDREIEEAENLGNSKKANLLGKIKQFYVLKANSKSPDERDSLDSMIEETRRQIEELDDRQQREDNEYAFDKQGFDEENDPLQSNKEIDLSESDRYYGIKNELRQSSKRMDQQDSDGQDVYGNHPMRHDASVKSKGKINEKLRTSQEDKDEEEKRLELEPLETLEDRRSRGLKEIFDFYTRQHMMIGRKATFEQIEYELSNLNMGEFMKFCKDFQIPLSKTKCAEVFKKSAKNSKEMFLEHFKDSLPKLIAMKNKDQIEAYEKRLKDVRKLINKRK